VEAPPIKPAPRTFKITIQREGTRAADAERKQSRNVEQIGLITRLAKVSASRVEGPELDRAKSVGKMNRKDRNEEYDDHPRCSEAHEGTKENQQSADNLDSYPVRRARVGTRGRLVRSHAVIK
jgi:hypothetical protein